MSAVVEVVTRPGFAAAHGEVDALLEWPLDLLSREEVFELWRQLESLRNRLAAVEHRFVAETEARGWPGELGARDVAAVIRGLLRVAPGEAKARARAAEERAQHAEEWLGRVQDAILSEFSDLTDQAAA